MHSRARILHGYRLARLRGAPYFPRLDEAWVGARSLISKSLPPLVNRLVFVTEGPPSGLDDLYRPSRTKQREGGTMTVLLTLEASRPGGASYRLGFGCNLPLAWIVAVLSRLF